MRTIRPATTGLALLLIGAVAAPILPAQALSAAGALEAGSSQLLARGGGGRGGGGGGRGGGGGSRGGSFGGGGGRPSSGFSGSGGGLNRGSSRPSGGWSNNVGGRSSPSLDRPSVGRDFSRPSAGTRDQVRPGGGSSLGQRTPAAGRPTGGSRDLGGSRDGGANRDLGAGRDLNRSGDRIQTRDVNRSADRTINRTTSRDVNRNWNRQVNIGNVNVNPGWARPGWGAARPWATGWYGGWARPAWGWWGTRAAVWGVGALATSAIINSAVNDAISNNQTYIVVPSTSYQLLFGSVQPSGSSGVTFAVTVDDSTFQLTADCNTGLLDGREPETAAEAELLNAACQVAYGAA